MNKKLVFAIAAAASICLNGAASADTINFSSGGGGTGTFTLTTFTFTGKGDAHPVSGIFAPIDCTNCVTMNNFNSASTNFQVASITSGGLTDIVDLTSVSFVPIIGGIDVFGGGTESLNGGVAQAISFFLTSQGSAGVATSYSGTINTVPLPSTWMMLIASLLGLGFFAYRGSKTRASAVSMFA